MKSLPRQIGSPLAALLRASASLCTCVLLAPCAALAQGERPARNNSSTRAPSKESKQKPSLQGDAKARRERRRAVAALAEVADGARSLADPGARAEVLSLAAHALWPADETSARALFRRAWESATAADLADAKRREEELRAARNDGSTVSVAETTTARFAALETVARRDTRMAEAFLQELKATATGDADGGEGDAVGADAGADAPRKIFERRLSPRGAQRLQLAYGLLERGEYLRARQAAMYVLSEGPTREFVQFLIRFRAKSSGEADALYELLLGWSAGQPATNANDVLVLSAYVVSPHVIITVSPEGSVQLFALGGGGEEGAEGVGIPTGLRRLFYEAAAALFVRLQPPQGVGPEALAEVAALYFAAGRLLPFFERDAPHYAETLRARADALAFRLDETRRERLAAHMPAESMRRRNPSDPLERFIRDASDPVGRAERTGQRLRAVSEAARRKLWDRARKLAADIADADARREAYSLIAGYQIKYLTESFADEDDDNDFERAAAFAREADVEASARARGLAQAAEMAERKGRRERASGLMEEAVGFALRAEKGSDQRLDALLLLATIAARLDPARAWELLPEVVRAANALDAPPIEAAPAPNTPGAFAQSAREGDGVSGNIFEPFPAGELFATMALGDFARTLAEAKMIEDAGTRASAIVAAARAVIERGGKNHGPATR